MYDGQICSASEKYNIHAPLEKVDGLFKALDTAIEFRYGEATLA